MARKPGRNYISVPNRLMLVIKRTTFTCKDSVDKTFSKLDRKVAKAQTLIHPLLNSTIATTKPWVGKLDRDNNEFLIIQTTPFFSTRIMEGNFFRLYVRGKFTEEAQQTKIRAEFSLGIRPTFLFALVSLFTLLAVVNLFKTNDWTFLIVGLTPFIIFICLLTIQVNKTESTLRNLVESY